MKKILCFILATVLLIGLTPTSGFAYYHSVVSEATVLMDAQTGEVLWYKNPNWKMYPASITKIMTGLLVLENCDPQEIVKVKSSALNVPKGYAHMALTTGETMRVDDAMYATMLASANDVANVLAEHVAGSQSAFTDMMNSRARAIGAEKTNFVNASGIAHKNHYTSAYDMALITREAIKNPQFMVYFGTDYYTIPATSHQPAFEAHNYNFMLLDDKDEYFPDAVGGKIGYTNQAKHTMCTVATRNGRTLICIVMGSTSEGKYRDTEVLLNYGFNNT